MKKAMALLFALMFALLANVQADDENEHNLYNFNVNGTWASDVSFSETSAKLVFENDTFTMTIKRDGEEVVKKGLFLQEAKRLLLVVIDDENHQSQMEVPYFVIDKDTMEITLERKTFMLERVS